MEIETLTFTEHARKRACQRNFSETAIRLVHRYGTRTAEGLLMTKQDAAEAIAERRLELEILARLRAGQNREHGDNHHA